MGQVMRSVRKTLNKSRDAILSQLRIKQKGELDSKIKQIKPKTFRQSIKFLVPEGRSFGSKGFSRRLGVSFGRKIFLL